MILAASMAMLGWVHVASAGAAGGTCFGKSATVRGVPDPAGDYAAKFFGTERADVIIGTPGPDLVLGAGGNDLICAGGGDDEIWDGTGNDRIKGEGGNDSFEDVPSVPSGRDQFHGGAGNDTLWLAEGGDTFFGEGGADFLYGDSATSSDSFFGGPGNDRARTEAPIENNDGTYSDGRPDALNGGAGQDACTVNSEDVAASCEQVTIVDW
jgi:Ca2+-binding RTX toxin-like protein